MMTSSFVNVGSARVAYRVLKRRLQLDDELLADLKDDVIFAKKLAVDEDDRVLVWTGETAASSPTSPPRQTRHGHR